MFRAAMFRAAICSVSGDGFDVQCLNSRLRIVDVKPEGKKNMERKGFMLGRQITTGNAFPIEKNANETPGQ